MSTNRKRLSACRKKYTTQYREQLKRELELGYREMGAINLELAEDGVIHEDE